MEEEQREQILACSIAEANGLYCSEARVRRENAAF